MDDIDDLENEEGSRTNYGQTSARGAMLPDRLGHILDVEEEDEILTNAGSTRAGQHFLGEGTS